MRTIRPLLIAILLAAATRAGAATAVTAAFDDNGLTEVRRGEGTTAELTRRVYGDLEEKLQVAAKTPEIGKRIDQAMEAIEKENPSVPHS